MHGGCPILPGKQRILSGSVQKDNGPTGLLYSQTLCQTSKWKVFENRCLSKDLDPFKTTIPQITVILPYLFHERNLYCKSIESCRTTILRPVKLSTGREWCWSGSIAFESLEILLERETQGYSAFSGLRLVICCLFPGQRALWTNTSDLPQTLGTQDSLLHTPHVRSKKKKDSCRILLNCNTCS